MRTLSLCFFKSFRAILFFLILFLGHLCPTFAQQFAADAKLTRYVSGASGAFDNDGMSWQTAKNLLQETINSLHEYMVKNDIHEGGRVFVAAGTYVPIASTEDVGGTVLNTSFILYEGITVYGGFKGTETSPEEREWELVQNGVRHQWTLKNPTILSGEHGSSKETKFVWNDEKQKYETTFPGNSYHVVWFGSNGIDPDTQRARPLQHTAGIDGCTITGGNASYKSMAGRHHTGYGGGAYLVKNSFLRNCILTKNEATRRGGAVYMDGGGQVTNCYIHTNQTLGIGGTEGYGGAVAVDDDGQLSHSVIVNNVGRVGGGVALSYNGSFENADGTLNLSALRPSAVVCLIANNTAAQEAGGVFFNYGGSVNHLTVVRNRCNGTDITIRGIRYGRSAGAYVLECGHIYNSVFWGGTVANRNIHMAVHNSSGINKRVRISYSGFEHHDITDWTGTGKNVVVNLETDNLPQGNILSNYMAFRNPTPVAGVWVTGDGSLDYLQQKIGGKRVMWIPSCISACRKKGVQMLDLHGENEYEYFKHIDVSTDIHGRKYEPSSDVGAFLTDVMQIEHATLKGMPTLFVDPSHGTLIAETVGASWDAPLNNLNEALTYFREKIDSKVLTKGQILIKEGTLNTLGEYYNVHMRSSYIKMVDHVTVMGGYPKELSGVELEKTVTDPLTSEKIVYQRDPLRHVTLITADLADDAYDFNSCHIITFDNVSHSVLDGVRISYANSLSKKLFENKPQFQHGGGIICWNTKLGQPDFKPGDMLGNVVRNCMISNNSAIKGSGVFVHAAAGTKVELALENCVIHNNESFYDKTHPTPEGPVNIYEFSTVYVGADDASGTRGLLSMDHCNIMKNVGHPVVTEGNNAKVQMSNSMVWANASQAFAISDYLGMTEYRPYLLTFGEGGTVNFETPASYCSFDVGTRLEAGWGQANLLHPIFRNSTRNVGITKLGDVTQYGGMPDFTPTNMNPLVNAADKKSMYKYDLSTLHLRNYGGAPDIGALENTGLKPRGQVYYVRPANKGGDDQLNDGLSWEKSFATLVHAIKVIHLLREQDKSLKTQPFEIWMSAGTYKEVDNNGLGLKAPEYGIQMLDGVSIRGGFLAEGNPGEMPGERDLSNSKPEYQTIIDGDNKRRVIRGVSEPTMPILLEGLTIQNGRTGNNNYGAGLYIREKHTLKNCLIQNCNYKFTYRDIENYYKDFVRKGKKYIVGGGGVYANGAALITNCKIANNSVYCDDLGEQFNVCGGGTYLVGATVINSLIIKNTVTVDFTGNVTSFDNATIIGAGTYISEKSQIYNCTFAYNEANTSFYSPASGGVWDDGIQDKDGVINQNNFSSFYNCIFWGNRGLGNTYENYIQVGVPLFESNTNNKLMNCYLSTFNSKTANGATGIEDAFLTNPTSKLSFGTKEMDVFLKSCQDNAPFNDDYSLKDIFLPVNKDSKAVYCINKGSDEAVQALREMNVVLDFTGAPRVQDCQIDKGAYEFHNTYAIEPDRVTEPDKLIFYVSQNGAGVNSGAQKENAACAEKLQLILDAAGRARADEANHEKEIVVRLAGSSVGVDYHPLRASSENPYGEDPRTWSILVPRGVILEGGWNADYTERDAVRNKCTLLGEYNTSDQRVEVYHVVTFTDYLYDEEGKIKRDAEANPQLLPKNKKFRSVLDGLHIEGGRATGDAVEHQYGGAAVVPDFAHVSNCVLRDNKATLGGGALYMKPQSWASGCLFEQNEAKKGGAVFVEEILQDLDDPTNVEDSLTRVRIFTSTFVNNKALQAGGGISYINNVRVNSCVFWKNMANTESNVDGKYENTLHLYGVEDYPFAYSAVENVRMPGINNQSVSTDNNLGTRFAKVSNPQNYYYDLTEYSVLAHMGMPIEKYKALQKDGQVAVRDFKNTPRYENDGLPKGSAGLDRNGNVDIGARSLGKVSIASPQLHRVLRRIYVTHPEKVNIDLVNKVLAYRETADGQKAINAQLGASFAFPMQSLNDALRYVVEARKNAQIPYEEKAYFEIFVSGGTFYPEARIDGKTGISRFNTFLVPEGVAVFGAMNPYLRTAEGYLCQNTPDLEKPVNDGYGLIAPDLKPLSLNTMDIIAARRLYDLNGNDIFEPWEFENQTLLSGKAINKDQINNVYHVVSVLTDPKYVGWMGMGSHTDSKGVEVAPSIVRLDGLQIAEGEAWHDQPNSNMMDYTGGGIFATGIYGEKLGIEAGKPVFGNYKFREIRLKVSHCRFIGNKAGLGGAIMNNVPADISSSSFEQNEVFSQTVGADSEKNPIQMDIKGLGSAIYTTNHVQLVNCLFANNEAHDQLKTGGQTELKNIYGAGTIGLFHLDFGVNKGQAITGRVSMLNCNVVNNKAQKYPAVFTQSPNNDVTAEKPDHNNTSLMNSLFWGNRSVDGKQQPHYDHVINFDKEDLTQANEALWFCAYEEGFGKRPSTKEDEDMRGAIIPYSTSLPRFFQSADSPEGRKHCYNYNIYLSRNNVALDGPNFTNPSFGPGADDFLPTANWLPFRQNNLTDNGWTFLQQKITNKGGDFDCQFVDKDGNPVAEENPQYFGGGAYLTFYNLLKMGNGKEDHKTGARYGNIGVPIGNEEYMRNNSKKVEEQKMLRISLDPNPSHEQTYIDIGLYEYQHVQLKPEEIGGQDPVDLIWVSQMEKPDNGVADGSSWDKPTSDLQRAIETLLSSRNDRRKEIRIMEGIYQPVYSFKENVGTEQTPTYEYRQGFRVDTKALNRSVVVPQGEAPLGVKSLTLTGGWSAYIRHKRDIESFRSYIKSPEGDGLNKETVKYLFDIVDAEQYVGMDYDKQQAEAMGVPVPLNIDGLTFMNCVREEGAPDDKGGAALYYRECKLKATAEPKLTVSNCVFMGSGRNNGIAAVKVENGGGRTIFYNSLFHSHLGNSLVAEEMTNVVNCTFALNGGGVILGKSTANAATDFNVWGSVFWENNQSAALGNLSELVVGDEALVKYNAFSAGAVLRPDNWSLSEDNHNLISGPNFVDPENDVVELRDFHLLPSVSLLNKYKGPEYWKWVESALLSTTFDEERDLAGLPRMVDGLMDLGAYEYQQQLQRVIYVDPVRVNNSGNGKSWGTAYCQSDMQRAIDMAAVYAASHQPDQAYVFMKMGNGRANTGVTLTLRSGVSIYGGISRSFMEVAGEDVAGYERKICYDRPAVANPEEGKTIIAGVQSNGRYSQLAVLDGFEVMPVKDQHLTTGVPAVHLTSNDVLGKPSITEVPLVVRNSVIHDFQKVGTPVVKVDNGLLYNVLVRHNSVQEKLIPVMSLGPQGWAVNTTVTSLPTFGGLEDTKGHFLNSIHAEEGDATFAPYFRPHPNIPEERTNDENLWFQLSEHSLDIDKGKMALPKVFTVGVFRGIIDYERNFDLLGNPRCIAGKVDHGCYETWTTRSGALQLKEVGRYYPQPSSVVYLENYPIEIGEKAGFAPEQTIIPGFVLLKQGGGWYGHGRATLKVNYLAIERKMGTYNLLSLPFACNYMQLMKEKVTYDHEKVISEPAQIDFIRTYDRNLRALSNYRYAPKNSNCWKELGENEIVDANQGVAVQMSGLVAPALHRFTLAAAGKNDFLYIEKGPKSVDLVQANVNDVSPDGCPLFTNLENMGWNVMGMPYLVNDYFTGQKGLATATGYAMEVPHLLYNLETDTGNYGTLGSWDASVKVSAGEGFLTQTATLDAVEKLVFALPEIPQVIAPVSKFKLLLKSEQGKDEVEIYPSVVAQKISYHWGVDGVKWMAVNENIPQLYLCNGEGARFSWVSAAPVDTDLPLGVCVAMPGKHTFALLAPEAYDGYARVWLTDHETGAVTDLKQSDYVVELDETLESENRFTLRFDSGASLDGGLTGKKYQVYIREGVLHIGGLDGGESICVYDIAGCRRLSAEATAREFTVRLNTGVYIVKVNGNVYKVR